MLNPLTTKFRLLAAALIDSRFEGSYCTFQLPKYQTVNDLKEKQSAVLALQNGLTLYENELAKAGISKDQLLHDLQFQLTVAEERAKIEVLKSGVNPNEAKASEANSNSKGT